MPAQDELRLGRCVRRVRWSAIAGALLLMSMGCTRRYYRDFADRDVYRIVQDRMLDWRWQLPPRPVEANPGSRMGDVHDPNHEPIPPDDPGARPFQITYGRPLEFVGWSKRGMAPVEDMSWMQHIPRDADGDIVLDGPVAMQIALMNNRTYQTSLETVYLDALSLTLERFKFFPQLFSSQTTQYSHFGARGNESNQLQLLTTNSLNWTLYSGAQLLTNFANSLIFEYDGHQFQTVRSALAVSLAQPLLQGAWARNFTQGLSLVERQTLYSVRNFAHFRRFFYVDTVSGYLNLLTLRQQIRNQQSQVDQLKRSLDESVALVRADLLDPLQRDNVAQQYQQSRFVLLSQEANYQTTLDDYRVATLGLPADFPMKIDEAILKKFELSDPRLDLVRKDNEKLYLALLQHDEPPTREMMAESARTLLDEFATLHEVSLVVGKELQTWQARIEAEKKTVATGEGPTEQDERESLARQEELAGELAATFERSHLALAEDTRATEKFLAGLAVADPAEAWEKLRQGLVSRDFRTRLAEQFVIQTQVRVHLIEVNPVDLTVSQAISVALANRLDLMNSLGQVTDAWRNVEVAGNQLLAGLNLFYNAQFQTAPNHLGILRFDAHQTQQFVGVQFSPPIVRRSQRNDYRAGQIAYQRARRAYMENHDLIVQAIRLDMRNLNLFRRQFEITREALLIAARQVEQAEYLARTSTGASSGAGQSAGLNLINAQNVLLSNKNNLIGNWVSYEVQRLGLYRDFDIMNIDAQGVWTNDDSIPTFNGGPVPTTPDPVGAPTEPLLPVPAPPAGSTSPFARS